MGNREETHTKRYTHIRTQALAHALYTHVHCNIVGWWYYTLGIADIKWFNNVK